MKKSSLVFLSLLIGVTLFSCKKEVPPELEVTVVTEQNEPFPNGWVEITVDGAEQGVLNPRVIAASKTDNFGKAFFKFDNTVLVDISLYFNSMSDLKLDSASALLETERSIDDDNVTEKKLVVRL